MLALTNAMDLAERVTIGELIVTLVYCLHCGPGMHTDSSFLAIRFDALKHDICTSVLTGPRPDAELDRVLDSDRHVYQ